MNENKKNNKLKSHKAYNNFQRRIYTYIPPPFSPPPHHYIYAGEVQLSGH